MTVRSESQGQKTDTPPRFRTALLLFVGVLVLLFWRDLLPGNTLANNDGPLGSLIQRAHAMPSWLTSSWEDLNTIGYRGSTGQLTISYFLLLMFGPVLFSKLWVPCALLFLGSGAWFFFRELGLSQAACNIGGLAAMLNSAFFSAGCWGVASHPIVIGLAFFAMAALADLSSPKRWARVIVAGLALGLGVADGADIGAMFSVLVAIFALYLALIQEGPVIKNLVNGVGRIVVVALFAFLISAQAVSVLVATNIKGIAGAKQDEKTKLAQWDGNTLWSLPKSEVLSLVVPGLFGYRMDTPTGMSAFESSYEGGAYWGQAGREPAYDRWVESGKQGPRPNVHQMRHTGGGFYAGVLVVLLAVWASLQSLRKENSVFSLRDKKWIWFWMGVFFVSLLLAFGRYAPFYRLFYALPFASTVRNPSKFTHIVDMSLVILFGFGVNGLWHGYLKTAPSIVSSFPTHLKGWWSRIPIFDRKWVIGCAITLGLAAVGWMMYASSRKALADFIESVGPYHTSTPAEAMAAFSVRQVGWFLLLFTLAAGLVAIVLSGWFGGRRAKVGAILLGTLLVVDMGRANQPWIIIWDYLQKYESNPIIEILRQKPYEHRVTIVPDWPFKVLRLPEQLAAAEGNISGLYGGEWTQQHFLYYNIQSLDIIQMSRMPEELMSFEMAFLQPNIPPTIKQEEIQSYYVRELGRLAARKWELTNTRYLLGAYPFLEILNQLFDPGQRRFRIAERFEIVPKPGIVNPKTFADYTVVTSTNGTYALFEFTGALPRAKLYSNWQIITNDQAMLQKLPSPDFDPSQSVIVADASVGQPPTSTNQNGGEVNFEDYAPKRIVLHANASTPSVLLLNDKFDPNWVVTVDGKPETLLRCNYIMRGVKVPPGAHTVEFRFAPSVNLFYVSLAGVLLGVVLVGFLAVPARPKKEEATKPERSPQAVSKK